MSRIYSVITGTGSYVPAKRQKNSDFCRMSFMIPPAKKFLHPNEEIVQKFLEITTIAERRYAEPDENTSDMAKVAAERAIETAGIDKEELDYIIFAHKFRRNKSGQQSH